MLIIRKLTVALYITTWSYSVCISDKYDEQKQQAQREIHDALMLDLEDKERAIKQGMHIDQNHLLT